MNKYLYIILLTSCPVFLIAQTDSTSSQGEVVSGEVVIEKNKEIVLPKAEKIFRKGDLIELDSSPLSIELTSFDPNLEWPPYETDVSFEKVNSDFPVDEYPNYVKFGYGNYSSPLLKVGFFERLGSFDLSNVLSFESFASGPVNGSNSANSIGSINISGKHTKDKIALTPYLNYHNERYRFYGNTDRLNPSFSSESLPSVRWSSFDIGTLIKGKHENITYTFSPKFSSTSQKPENGETLNKEREISATGSFIFKIDKQLSSGLHLEGHSSKYEGGLNYNRSLFQVNPWIGYQGEDYFVKAGINVASNEVGDTNQSGIYPNLVGELSIHPNWKLLAHLTGSTAWQNLNGMMLINEFLGDSLQILNGENKYSVGGVLKGKLIDNLMADFGISFAKISNLPFFVPDTSDSSMYNITYDRGSTQRITFSSKLTYTISSNSFVSTSMELNSYSMGSLDRPWHLPTYMFRAHSSHKIREKLIISTTFLVMGGIKAPTNVDFRIEELDPIFDLALDIDYLIADRVSAFVSTRNLFNDEYERYLGYPVRGVTFKIGGQYRF